MKSETKGMTWRPSWGGRSRESWPRTRPRDTWPDAAIKESREHYIASRWNTVLTGAAETHGLPTDGRYNDDWTLVLSRMDNADKGWVWYYMEYAEGAGDKEFMEAQDELYLSELARSNPDLFLKEMTPRNELSAAEQAQQLGLDLRLSHHQHLQEKYASERARILAERAPSASAGEGCVTAASDTPPVSAAGAGSGNDATIDMPLLSIVEKIDFNRLLNTGLASIAEKKWVEAQDAFIKLEQLSMRLPETPFMKTGLRYYVFLCKILAQSHLGEIPEAAQHFFDYVGYIYYAESGAGFFSQNPPTIPLDIHAKLLESHLTYPWLVIDDSLKSHDIKMEILKSFNALRKHINLIYDQNEVVNKGYLAGISPSDLNFPSYVEFALAANDAYDRTSTTANSIVVDCLKKPEAPGLAADGWELLCTARQSPRYIAGQYFGKAYQKTFPNGEKVILIAHKGTDHENDIDADKSIFYRRWPIEYYEQANAFLKLVQSRVAPDQVIYMTGHSLGAVLAELLAYETNIPTVTFDSPGVREIIESRDGRDILFPEVPVLSIAFQCNIINSINTHVGRLLCVPHHVIPEGAFDFSTRWFAERLAAETGRAILKALALPIIPPKAFDELADLYAKICLDVKNHKISNFLTYFNNRTAQVSTVVHWPSGVQDGSKPIITSTRERFLSLDYFPRDLVKIFKHAKALLERHDFPTQHQIIKNILAAIELTDEFGKKSSSPTHLLLKGLLTVDQLRICLAAYFFSRQHDAIKQYLLTTSDEIDAQATIIDLVDAPPKAMVSTLHATDSTTAVASLSDSSSVPKVLTKTSPSVAPIGTASSIPSSIRVVGGILVTAAFCFFAYKNIKSAEVKSLIGASKLRK